MDNGTVDSVVTIVDGELRCWSDWIKLGIKCKRIYIYVNS